MTKREYFETLKEIIATTEREDALDLMNFVDHEIDLLNRKSSSKKPTERQKENMNYKEIIKDMMREAGTPITISTMMEDERLKGLTNQRINGMLIQLGVKHGTGEVITTYVKGKAHYSLVTE